MRNEYSHSSTKKGPETVLILDFGSQYAQLIARRVREAGAFSLLVAHPNSGVIWNSPEQSMFTIDV